jgi:hypothetical protein
VGIKVRTLLFSIGLILIAMNGLGPTANVTGYVCLLFSLYLSLKKKCDFGPWWMWVGFVCIVPIAVIQNTGLTSVGMALIAPLVYLTALNIDRRILNWSFGFASVVASVSIIIFSLFVTHGGTGGLVDTTNYNLGIAVVLLGALLGPKQWRWLLFTLAVPSVLLSTAQEGLFGLAVIGVVCIIRKDIGVRVLPIAVAVVIGAVALLVFHQPEGLYHRLHLQLTSPSGDILTGGRWSVYAQSLKDIQLSGHGYDPVRMFFGENPQDMAHTTIHNIPLLILYQIGPLALLGWLIMVFGTLWKTSEKYLIVGLIALSIFDHFLFTQLAFWTWGILGVAHQSRVKDWMWK